MSYIYLECHDCHALTRIFLDTGETVDDVDPACPKCGSTNTQVW